MNFTPINFNQEKQEQYRETLWIEAWIRMKELVAQKQEKGEVIDPHFKQFWNTCSFPIYTTSEDRRLFDVHKKWLDQFFNEGLVRSMNVYCKKYDPVNLFAVFGEGGLNLMETYEDALLSEEALEKIRKKMEEDTGVPFKEKHYKDIAPQKNESEQWMEVFEEVKALCKKYQLRGFNLPFDMNVEESRKFMNKIDQTLEGVAQYLQAPNEIIGLGGYLSMKARSLGSIEEQNEHLTPAEQEKAQAIKKESDKFSGAYNLAFIQIQMDREFEGVVLAHEWMHALDHWVGSRELVKANPGANWMLSATRVAWAGKPQSKAMMQWADMLKKGLPKEETIMDSIMGSIESMAQNFGMKTQEKKPEILDVNMPGLNHPFMAETRMYYEPYQVNLLKTLEEMTVSRILKAFPMPPEDGTKAALKLNEIKWKELEVKRLNELPKERQNQIKILAHHIVDEAKLWAKKHEKTVLKSTHIQKHFENFRTEWGQLAQEWIMKVVQEITPDKTWSDEEKKTLKEETEMTVMQAGIASIFMNRLKPESTIEDHYKQAIRMDIMGGGGVQGYFSTPWEMLAYKFEELYKDKHYPQEKEDPVGFVINQWLKEEVVPALMKEVEAIQNLQKEADQLEREYDEMEQEIKGGLKPKI